MRYFNGSIETDNITMEANNTLFGTGLVTGTYNFAFQYRVAGNVTETVTIVVGGGGGSPTIIQQVSTIFAENYTLTSLNLASLLDFVLAKGQRRF